MNDAWHIEYLKKRADKQASLDDERPALLNKLRAQVLINELKNPIVLTYEGYGDSGSFEDVPSNICNETQDYLWDILTSSEGGWENNEGGRGNVTWDVNEDKISVNHVQYHTEETSRTHEF